MDLTTTANAAFARAKEARRAIFDRANTTPAMRDRARREKELQLKELAAKQAARAEQDKREARAEAAREHHRPELKPAGESSVSSKRDIEKKADLLVAKKWQSERGVIESKTIKQLGQDADRRRDNQAEAAENQGGTKDIVQDQQPAIDNDPLSLQDATPESIMEGKGFPAAGEARPVRSQKPNEPKLASDRADDDPAQSDGLEGFDLGSETRPAIAEQPKFTHCSVEDLAAAVAVERAAREARDQACNQDLLRDPGRVY